MIKIAIEIKLINNYLRFINKENIIIYNIILFVLYFDFILK